MKLYISENNKLYYEGQILQYFDIHKSFVDNYKINIFVVHTRKDKSKYIVARLFSTTRSYDKISINVELLDKNFKCSN